MERYLGLDPGPGSLGWGVVDDDGAVHSLVARGTSVFSDGVGHDHGREVPLTQARTDARAARRLHFRSRLRKIRLLEVLMANDLCPSVPPEALMLWKSRKIPPSNGDFVGWLRTDEAGGSNPYYCRFAALTRRLDLDNREARYLLGRAFYHLAQRRGFLSNRRDAAEEAEAGKVMAGISALDSDMQAAGCRYLGEYFYRLYQSGMKVRCRYTSRNGHYRKEFDAICERQSLPAGLAGALSGVIFHQRPLRSQKGTVGRCTFEPSRHRCPESHPAFEEFRKLHLVNNIRVKGPGDSDYRPLSEAERKRIDHLFYRKSRPHFGFEDIAKAVAGRGQTFGGRNDAGDVAYRFSQSMSASVSGCPVTAALRGIFGTPESGFGDWKDNMCRQYVLSQGKTQDRILDDVWHVLFSFRDDSCLEAWGRRKLLLDGERLKAFVSVRCPRRYASLSLCAIRRILPYLREGFMYDTAVFLANLKSVLPSAVWNDEGRRRAVIGGLAAQLEDFHANPLNRGMTKAKLVRDCLRDDFNVGVRRLDRLYHPSMVDVYPAARPGRDGLIRLGSPRISSLRNPVAMRTLLRTRAIVNSLLADGVIDSDTRVNVELSRELNGSNRRIAIQKYQEELGRRNSEYADRIRELYRAETRRDIEPTDDDILRYRLWEEQGHMCLYTGNMIGIADFLGADPRYDIEHTVPRSMKGDNSQMNKTLCESAFNRQKKMARLPSQLGNYGEIMARIDGLGWQKTIWSLRARIRKEDEKGRQATDRETRDKAIQRKYILGMELAYWEGKLERFRMTEVPEGFSSRSGVDTGVIGRYMVPYLKTVFKHVYVVKGETTSEFRKMWGLQEKDAAKVRDNHVHHCIDAITIACIGKREYDQWARYKTDVERYHLFGGEGKPVFPKPWPSFTEDVGHVADEVLVSHYEPDYMLKRSKRKLRVRGRIRHGNDGQVLYAKGDAARGSLHRQHFYGAVQSRDGVRYVIRKSLSELIESDVVNIVDEAVRVKVESAIREKGFTAAMSGTVWMNEEKCIPIRKVRIYAAAVRQPVVLGMHRDLSALEYKRYYYVMNEYNYCMAIYEGSDSRNRLKRDFAIVRNIDAARFYRASSGHSIRDSVVPSVSAKGLPLRCILRTGTMVLLYERTPDEIYGAKDVRELVPRLYKVAGLNVSTSDGKAYGRIMLRHHQEARNPKCLEVMYGQWKLCGKFIPSVQLSVSRFNALVEGYDFVMDVKGAIRFLHH